MGTAVTGTGAAEWHPPAVPEFNLITEPWIPVLTVNGTREELGLRDLLARSCDIESISADSVLVETAVLRLLVALLCHAHQGPRDVSEWRRLWDAPSLLDEEMAAYLGAHEDRFFLLHPDHPFAQASPAVLAGSGKANEKSLAELSHQRASGTAKRLFDKSLDDKPLPATAAEAARTLIAYQCWAPRGGQGYGSSRLVGRSLVCIPIGGCLQETALLNTVGYDPRAGEPIPVIDADAPGWLRDRGHDRIAADRPVEGLVDLLTRRPRAVCLLTGSVGEMGRVLIAAGERIPGDADARDPNLVYGPNRVGGAHTERLRAGAPVWTELPALLYARAAEAGFQCAVLRWAALTEVEQRRITWRAVSLDSNQAEIRSISASELKLPVRIADDPARRRSVIGLVEGATRASRALDRFINDLGRRGQLGSRARDAKARAGVRRQARARAGTVYWSGASQIFADMLMRLGAAEVGRDQADRANVDWVRGMTASVNAGIDAVGAITGTSAVALIDSAEARAWLNRRLPGAIGTPVEATSSGED